MLAFLYSNKSKWYRGLHQEVRYCCIESKHDLPWIIVAIIRNSELKTLSKDNCRSRWQWHWLWIMQTVEAKNLTTGNWIRVHSCDIWVNAFSSCVTLKSNWLLFWMKKIQNNVMWVCDWLLLLLLFGYSRYGFSVALDSVWS